MGNHFFICQEFEHTMKEKELSKDDIEFNDRVAGNPIHAYNLVKRFVVDWKRIEQDLAKDEWKETAFKLKKRRLGTVQPKDDDLHKSAQAIIKLQETYKLEVRDLSRGDIGFGKSRYLTAAKLNAQDCLFMGKHCFNSGTLASSLEWFEEAWILAGIEGNKTIRQDQVQQFLDHAAKEVKQSSTNIVLPPRQIKYPVDFDDELKTRKRQIR